MDGPDDNDPLDWILMIIPLLSEDWQRAWVRDALSFLTGARWRGSQRFLWGKEFPIEELGNLANSVGGTQGTPGNRPPEEIVAFILSDWERLQVGDLECILLRLSDLFPAARIQALPLHREGDAGLEIVIAAGDPLEHRS